MTRVRLPRGALSCALVAALAVAAYFPVLGNDFVFVDDAHFVVNPARRMQAPPVEVLRWAFTETSYCNWYPLTRLSHAFDVRRHGLDPGGHHRTNLLIHAANAVLLLLVLRGATGAPWRSLAVAALFAVHPLQAESVAWVSQRSTLLSTFFGFLTLAAHGRYARRPSAGRFLAVAAAFACGLMSKPILVTLPVVLLLWDFWPLGRSGRRADPRPGAGAQPRGRRVAGLIAEKVPLALCAALVAVVTLRTQTDCAAVRTLDEVSLGSRLLGVPVNYLGYLVKLALPVDLHPFHLRSAGAVPWAQFAGAVLLLGAVTALALLQRGRRPHLATGWLWFLVVLSPVIGLFQTGDQTIAERYAYLSITGVLVAAVWTVPPGWPAGRRRRVAAGCALLLGCLGALSVRQAHAWRDTVALTDRVLEREPGNVVVRAIRGEFFFGTRDYDAALRELALLIPRVPRLASARHNLALVLEARGDLEAGVHHLERAVALAPGDEGYRRLLADWTARRDAAAGDAAAWAARVQRDAGDLAARRELGAALFELGRFEEAAREFRAALALAPGQDDVSRLLERALRHRPNGEEEALRRGETDGGPR